MLWPSRTTGADWLERSVRGALFDQAEARILSWSEDKTVRLWEEIAHAHALTYDDDGFREAVLRAIALCTDDEKRAALFGEGAFQSAIRWQKEADRELIEDWSAQALDFSRSATRARGYALVARALCRPAEAEADAREAERIGLALDEPAPLRYVLVVLESIEDVEPHAGAPTDTWSYRIMAGYFDSDAFPRPTGFVPGIISGTTCTRVPHPFDPSVLTGCGTYPPDRAALRVFLTLETRR